MVCFPHPPPLFFCFMLRNRWVNKWLECGHTSMIFLPFPLFALCFLTTTKFQLSFMKISFSQPLSLSVSVFHALNVFSPRKFSSKPVTFAWTICKEKEGPFALDLLLSKNTRNALCFSGVAFCSSAQGKARRLRENNINSYIDRGKWRLWLLILLHHILKRPWAGPAIKENEASTSGGKF